MNVQSVSLRRRKTGQEVHIKAADMLSAAFCLLQTKEKSSHLFDLA
jgi:hypothetical protein